MMEPLSTAGWAEQHGISAEPAVPPVPDYTEPCARSAREIAVRAIVLQGVVAVASGVGPKRIVRWFHEQGIWDAVSPQEIAFFKDRKPTERLLRNYHWHVEAEWTLLWVVGKVDDLGLPTKQCDTARLVDEIIPALGSDITPFVESAQLRLPGFLLAEDDRTYNLWCYLHLARRKGAPVPSDLDEGVLYERRYAFEWLGGTEDWDEVTCDA